MELAARDAVRDVAEGKALLRAQALLTLQLLALVGDIARLLLSVYHVELVAGRRRAVETEHDGRLCRLHVVDALVTLVEQRLDTAPRCTREHDVANVERAVAHENGRHVTAALVERRLDDGTRGLAVGVGLQVEHVGLKQHFLHEVVHANALLGADLLALVLTAPLLHEEVHVGKVLTYPVGIGSRLVYLVDGEHHWHACRLTVGDGLLGGRHHGVVGGDDDDGDIGDLCATGTHGGESLVSRGVEERHLAAALQRHAVSADVLGDAARLAGDDVGVAYMVEQRCLTVVDVTHDRDNRGTRHELALVVFILADGLLHLSAHIFGLEAKLLCHHVDGLGVEALVDGGHDADAHQRGDDLRHGDVHHRGELRHGNKLGELQHLALLLLGACLSVELLLHGLALLLAVFGALLVLALACQACQRLLHLACHVLVVDLSGLVVAVAVLLFLAVPVLVPGLLVGGGVDVHLVVVYALALAAVVGIGVVATVLLALALTLPLRARLLLWPCA